MQSQDQAPAKPRSNVIWFVVGGVLLLCCCIVVIGALLSGPTLRNTLNQINNSLQNVNPSGAESPTSVPTGNTSSGGPVAGGLGDTVLKTDVWNSIVNYYASSQSCTDVSSVAIKVTQTPDSKGVWKEAWTVAACGKTTILNVKFTPSPKGGTDYDITQ